ncbi:MAG: DUF167 domain-containing protein [Fimbriimonadia bacterium]|nr:DUF167 domain-containing protein [Fimbriimonadia bacterium]
MQVKVIPRASRSQLSQTEEGQWVARVTAPPVEGEANQAVIKLLAQHFNTAPSRIELLSGSASRTKRFRISFR